MHAHQVAGQNLLLPQAETVIPQLRKQISLSQLMPDQRGSGQADKMRAPPSERVLHALNTFAEQQRNNSTAPAVLPEGGISREFGFLESVDIGEKLHGEFKAWDDCAEKLPDLIRHFSVRKAAENLPLLNAEKLSVRELPRAALILSSLAHAWQYHDRNPDLTIDRELPDAIQKPWEQVCSRLGRGFATRRSNDDFINNAKRPVARATELQVPYFGRHALEESESAGVQAKMEQDFKDAIPAMIEIQSAVYNNHTENLAQFLFELAHHINTLSIRALDMSPKVGERSIDPVIWFRTYPEIGYPLNKHEMDNSGIDGPLFHALDSFFGRYRSESLSELKQQQENRMRRFSPAHKTFIKSFGDIDLNEFVEQHGSPEIKNALLQAKAAYRNLFEIHRKKAIGSVEVMFATGRSYTPGKTGQDEPIQNNIPRMVGRINDQMLAAVTDRFGDMTTDVTAVVKQLWSGGQVRIYELDLNGALACKAGDRIAVKVPGASDGEQRQYSIAKVIQGDHGAAAKVHLMVNHADDARGPAYLATAARSGYSIQLSHVFSPEFRLPYEGTTSVVMFGQGAGSAAFFAYLLDPEQSSGRENRLYAGFKTIESVPYLDELKAATVSNNIIIKLALSIENRIATLEKGFIHFKTGKQHIYVNDVMKDDETLLGSLLEQKAQLYICGSNYFLKGVHQVLAEHEQLVQPDVKAQRSDLPRALSYNMHLHEETYTPVPDNKFPEFSLQEVSGHNQPENLWTLINGKVYNLTDYAMRHPGGVKVLLQYAGTFADRKLEQIHGFDNQMVNGLLAQYQVGTVKQPDMALQLAQAPEAVKLSKCIEAENTLIMSTRFAKSRDIAYFLLEKSLKQMPGWLQNGLVNTGAYDSVDRKRLWPVHLNRITDAVNAFSRISREQISGASENYNKAADIEKVRSEKLYDIFDEVAALLKEQKQILQAGLESEVLKTESLENKAAALLARLGQLDSIILNKSAA